jgi:rubrerythrin
VNQVLFGLFRSKKQRNAAELLSGYVVYQKTLARLGRGKSLQKLGRRDEAEQVFMEAEKMATNHLRQHPHDKFAHMTLALFYSETAVPGRAAEIINRILNSAEFALTDEEQTMLRGELQNLRRERPSEQRSDDDPKDFTKIYCCQRCGRLHNYVSLPCPHCDWSPQTIEETARSIVLSNPDIDVASLLMLCREMAKGRSADNVVPNLETKAKSYLNDPALRAVVEKMFRTLRENEHKNHHDMNMLRECTNCGVKLLLSTTERCEKCKEPVTWPDAIRVLVCMDNLLSLCEQRLEVSSSKEFSEFVCLLVRMLNNLLRKQESPSDAHREYALQLLEKMRVIVDLNQGAIIDTTNPRAMKVHLMKDRMLADTETSALFLLNELEYFVATMIHGIKA